MKRITPIILIAVGLTACGTVQAKTNEAFVVDDSAPATTEAPETDDAPYTLDDFTIELITLESECFDSAGALVTVEPDLYIRDGEYPGKATLVFEIRGGEHTETFRMELDGDGYTTNEEMIATATCSANLTAVPTNLIERSS